MSSLLRNLPVIILAVAVTACVYFLYQNINNVSDRLDQISHELYYSINSVNDLTSRLGEMGIVKEDIPATEKAKENTEMGQETAQQQPTQKDPASSPKLHEFPTITELVEGQHPEDEDMAESVLSHDVKFMPNQPSENRYPPTQREQPDQDEFKEVSIPTSKSKGKRDAPSETVQDYIGNLENFVKKNDDADSVAASEISSASALQTRKKVPPYAAKTFDVDHEEEYEGKLFRVIRTKTGVVRWSGAKPLNSADESDE